MLTNAIIGKCKQDIPLLFFHTSWLFLSGKSIWFFSVVYHIFPAWGGGGCVGKVCLTSGILMVRLDVVHLGRREFRGYQIYICKALGYTKRDGSNITGCVGSVLSKIFGILSIILINSI